MGIQILNMSIENSNIIDLVTIDKNGKVVLTISDHLPWDEKNEHLHLLQEKINAYIVSIESGDLYTQYPETEGKAVVIALVIKFNPSRDGEKFIKRVQKLLENAGYYFTLDRDLISK